jgi:hypothetical protein
VSMLGGSLGVGMTHCPKNDPTRPRKRAHVTDDEQRRATATRPPGHWPYNSQASYNGCGSFIQLPPGERDLSVEGYIIDQVKLAIRYPLHWKIMPS